MIDPKISFKILIEKMFEESLGKSKLMNDLVGNVTVVASELARIAELLVSMNERIGKHEQAITVLLNIQNEKNKKENIVDFTINSKQEPPTKPN
jgi:hypothetical protein